MITETIATRIQQRLEQLGLSARAASLRAGLAADGVRNILRGKSESPRGDTLHRLAEALGVTVEWLLSGAGPQSMAPSVPAPPDPDRLVMRDQGIRLRRLRECYGAAAAAAEQCGVALERWQAMEAGTVPVDAVSLSRLCDLLQVGPAYVVTGGFEGMPAGLVRELVQAELQDFLAAGRRALAGPNGRQDKS